MNVQTLIHARWVIPVDPDTAPHGAALPQHAVAIDGGRIVAIVPSDQAREQITAKDVIECPTHALMPGLVNAHGHAAMSLLRGVADDLPLHTWLNDHIWPLEGQFASYDFVRAGTQLAMAEMLLGGTTTFADMYFFPDAAAKAAEAAGMRAVLGMILIDFPTAWAGDADEYLQKGLALRDDLRAEPLLTTMFAPHAPYTVSDGPLEKIRGLADETDTPIQMHVHETAQEVKDAGDERPLARLHRLGLLTPNFTAVHMTQLRDDEIELAAKTGISVVHCPESNMKLASGACRVQALIDAGVNVAIGTDGAASNNNLDMIGEMRSAALLGKLVANNGAGAATATSAADMLRAATLGGAQALGLGDHTGSITVGKWADLTAIDLSDPATTPTYDPVSAIVYAASSSQVKDVWVAGRARVRHGVLTALDWPNIAAETAAWRSRIVEAQNAAPGSPAEAAPSED